MANDWSEQAENLEALASQFGNIQQKALRAVVAAVKPRVVEVTPSRVDDKQSSSSLKYGELKASVRGRVLPQKADSSAAAVVDWGKKSYVAHIVDVGHRAPHARTMARAGRPITGKPTPAYPFVRGAQDSTAAAAQTAYEEAMTAEIEKALSGS